MARGWLWRPTDPTDPVQVDLYVDRRLVDSQVASGYRKDLELAGKGTGRHGFVFNLPPGLDDGSVHEIAVRSTRTARDLTGSPRSVHVPRFQSQPGQLLVLEPGLSVIDLGHEAFVGQEILAACREMGVTCTVMASAGLRSNQRAPVDFLPFFSFNTYHRFDGTHDDEALAKLLDDVKRDYNRLDVSPGTKFFCHGASPWHLKGLSDALQGRKDVSIAIGLIFPPSFWTSNPALQAALEAMTWEAINALEPLKPFVYSETGFTRRGGQLIKLPVHALPMSEATLATCAERVHARPQVSNGLVNFGFFGAPRATKGALRILDAVRIAGLDPEAARVTFFLPPQFADHAAEFEAVSTVIRCEVGPFSNDDYLSQMSAMTAVLCPYDRTIYDDEKMSGIVADAAALAKPVIVTSGTSLQKFLDRLAPDTAVPVDESPRSLATALSLSADFWAARTKGAATSIVKIHEARSFRGLYKTAFAQT